MDDNQISPKFIEAMVDRVISALSAKLEVLDISLDYIAAALIDDATAMDIKSRQRRRGRLEERIDIADAPERVRYISDLRNAFGRQHFDVEANRGLIQWIAQLHIPARRVEKILADKRYAQESQPERSWFGK
jgi:hypothetical protein